jgi:hypothetical protein
MIDTNFNVEAIFSILPGSQFIVGDSYSSLDWHSTDQVKPTEAEFDAALKTVKATHAAQEYARNREIEYAALNQFEMQYDDEVNSTTTWKDAIVAIKTKWPKNNTGPVE